MNLTTAIKVQSNKVKYQYSACQSDEGDATKLGIQALIRLKELRLSTDQNPKWLIPGETED